MRTTRASCQAKSALPTALTVCVHPSALGGGTRRALALEGTTYVAGGDPLKLPLAPGRRACRQPDPPPDDPRSTDTEVATSGQRLSCAVSGTGVVDLGRHPDERALSDSRRDEDAAA